MSKCGPFWTMRRNTRFPTLISSVTGGYSGTTAGRPEYCRMLQAVTSGHVANLVVAKLDRLIRGNVLDCGRVVKMMLDNNVTLYSIEKGTEAAHQAISLANAIEVAYQERGRM